ncbi:MAG: DUF1549 and DUF1553 domain-containing protein, partial [Pirellulales bacterium]
MKKAFSIACGVLFATTSLSAENAKDAPRHWAYAPPARPALPEVEDPNWCRTPIDYFVLAMLENRGLPPSAEADRTTWLRRASLDLVGLPPSADEIEQFLADSSDEAKARVVDRLLSSPHFGERWAQPWLDLARYGDSTGIHEDELRPTWAWRDWVIGALNDDMPFDQFTVEQLAGDLLPGPTPQQRVATGFHRASPLNTEAGTPKEARRTRQVLDRVNVTGTVWLGTTFQCAQCHDHRHDPLTQREYYSLAAFFNNTPDESGGDVGPGRIRMAGPQLKVAGTSTFVMQEMAKSRATRVFQRGNYETPGDVISPVLPNFLHAPAEDSPANRLGLARWIVDPANPLTSRVTVNRWWAEVFGAGLVRTIGDFGAMGDRPTHPELLDWLAVEMVERGWSMKHILRTIVLSSTYAQSSRVTARQADPDARWLSRAPRLRLSAEAIRDNALSIAGLLTPTVGGPPVYPPQPPNLWWIRDQKSPKYETSQGESRYRRSIYTVWRRTYLHPSLAVFDAPDRVTCTVDRERSNTPLQALTLLNDPIYLEAAFELAGKLSSLDGGTEQGIARGFRMVTARTASERETARLVELYGGRLERFAADPKQARKLIESVRGDRLPGVDMGDDRAVAELGAWFHVANVLLNLDETITRG